MLNALTVGEGVLQHFWNLASLDEEVRLQAAISLVEEVVSAQTRFQEGPPASAPAANGDGSGAEGPKAAKTGSDSGSDDGMASDDDMNGDGEEDEDMEEEEEQGGEDAATVDEALRGCSPTAAYCLKRLTRGLGSSRQGARQGFSLALTLLMARLVPAGALSPAAALSLQEALLPVHNSMKGSEAREALLGRAFGLGALVRSGALDAASAPPAGQDAAAAAVEVVARIADLWGRKTFLREACAAVLVDLTARLDIAALARLWAASPALRSLLSARGEDLTPDALWVAVRLWRRLPGKAIPEVPCLPGPFKPDHAAALLGSSHIVSLLPALRASTAAHPRLHSIWPALLSLCIPGFSEERGAAAAAADRPAGTGSPAALASLWASCVEGQLLSGTASHERRYLALTLFQVALPHLTEDIAHTVFSQGLLGCIASNAVAKTNYLHHAARKCLERLEAFAEGKTGASEAVRAAALSALQAYGGGKKGGGFDHATRGHVVQKLVKGLDSKSVTSFLDAQESRLLETLSQDPMGSAPAAGAASANDEDAPSKAGLASGGITMVQRRSLDQYFTALKSPQVPDEQRDAAVRRLAMAAFLRPGQAAAPGTAGKKKGATPGKAAAAPAAVVSAADAELLRSVGSVVLPAAPRKALAAAVVGCLGELSGRAHHAAQAAHRAAQRQQQRTGGGDAAAAEEAAAAAPVAASSDPLLSVAASCSQLVAGGAQILAAASDDAAQASLRATLTSLWALGTNPGEHLNAAQRPAVAHLAACAALFLLADSTAIDADLTQDLCSAVARLGAPAPAPASAKKAAAKRGKGAKAAEEEEEEEEKEPSPMDVLVDVFLSLLGRAYDPLPSNVMRVAVEQAFRSVSDKVTATNVSDMLDILSKHAGATVGAEDEEDGEDIDMSGDESESEEEEDGEGEESGSEEEGTDGEEDETAARRAAAGAAGPAPKAKKADSDAESDGDDDAANDEEMFAMDPAIEAYLSNLKQQREGARAAHQAAASLRLRVCSLLEIFCRRCPDSPLLPTMVMPLLSALRRCPSDQQALRDRIVSLVAGHVSKGKARLAGGSEPDKAELGQSLTKCWALASRSERESPLGEASQAALIYLLRLSSASSDPDTRALAPAIATRALDDFFKSKKCRLPAKFFDDLFLRAPDAGVHLIGPVLIRAVASRSETLRVRALYLAAAAITHAPGAQAGLGEALREPQGGLATAIGPVLRPVGAAGGFADKGRHVEALSSAVRLLELVRKRKLVETAELYDAVSDDLAAGQAAAESLNKKAKGLLSRAAALLGQAGDVVDDPQPKQKQKPGKKQQPAAKANGKAKGGKGKGAAENVAAAAAGKKRKAEETTDAGARSSGAGPRKPSAAPAAAPGAKARGGAQKPAPASQEGGKGSSKPAAAAGGAAGKKLKAPHEGRKTQDSQNGTAAAGSAATGGPKQKKPKVA